MRNPPRSIAGLVAFALTIAPFHGIAKARGASETTSLTRAAYEQCQTQSETAFQSAIERITINAFETSTARLDYQAIVDDAWRDVKFDTVIDSEVDASVETTTAETSWGSLISSLINQKQAQELATAVAERVYRSQRVKSKIEELATVAGEDIGKRIEFAAEDAAKPALACLQAFLGDRYGTTVTQAVTTEAQKDFTLSSEANDMDVSSGGVLKNSTGGLAGAAILLMRRQLANMARLIGARLVGNVLARLVSVVAGGVGLALIAKDLWELRNGVLPIIADEMKSPETKQKVRQELAESIKTEMKSQVRSIASNASQRIVSIWREFKSAHNTALEWAERDDKFKTFLDNVRPEKLAQLDEVIYLIRSAEGDAGLTTRLADGSLEQAVKVIPKEAMTIARETRRLDDALHWHALAGNQLNGVIENGLHRSTTPNTLTSIELTQILSMNDKTAANRLASLPPEMRRVLLSLEAATVRKLAMRLDSAQLAVLTQYLNGLETTPRQTLLNAIAEQPARMVVLGSQRVRKAVVSSADQTAAIDMLLKTQSRFEPGRALGDAKLVLEGKISPILLWDAHPSLIVLALVLAAIILLLARRIFRRPAKAQTSAIAASASAGDASGDPS